jgi:hypothetical protein
MMTNNPELMDFTLKNEGEIFNPKEVNIASTLQNLMDVTPAYLTGMNTQH